METVNKAILTDEMNFTLLKSIAKNSFVNFTWLGGVPNPIESQYDVTPLNQTVELDLSSGIGTWPSSTKLGT